MKEMSKGKDEQATGAQPTRFSCTKLLDRWRQPYVLTVSIPGQVGPGPEPSLARL